MNGKPSMYEILISIHTRRYARRLAHTHTHTDTHAYTNIYEDKMKSSRSSLRETRDKQPFGRDPERSWCHRYTTSMIKLFWSKPMPFGGSIGQGEQFSAWPTTDLKLGTSGRWVGTRAGDGVTSILV